MPRSRRHSRRRRSRRRSRFNLRGGSSCAARQPNSLPFGLQQRGGTAPFNSSGPLLDASMRVMAQDNQIAAINESQMFGSTGQAGGRRRSRSRRNSYRNRRRSRRRRQFGGGELQAYGQGFDLGFPRGGADFATEATVNAGFRPFQGAQ